MARAAMGPPACSTWPPAARAALRRRAPARDAGARAGPAAAAARARRADRAPRPALPGRVRRRCCGGSTRERGHDGRCSSRTTSTSPPRCATACCCSDGGARRPGRAARGRCCDEARARAGVRLSRSSSTGTRAAAGRSCASPGRDVAEREEVGQTSWTQREHGPGAREAGEAREARRRSRHGPATVSGERRPGPAHPAREPLSGNEAGREGRDARDDPRVRRPAPGRSASTLSRQKERSNASGSFGSRRCC